MEIPTTPLGSDAVKRTAFVSKDEIILDKILLRADQDELELDSIAFYTIDMCNHCFDSKLLPNHWDPPHELTPWPTLGNMPQVCKFWVYKSID
jgi:hypothetical protein